LRRAEVEFKGVKIIIIGVIILIAGFWLSQKVIVTYEEVKIPGLPTYRYPTGYFSLNPYGWLLIAIGASIAIFGIWRLSLSTR